MNVGVKRAKYKTETLPDGGTGKGTLTVDASSDILVLNHELEITGVKAQPFLAEVMGVNRISGTAAIKFDVGPRGETA
jgi:hypothetical protein